MHEIGMEQDDEEFEKLLGEIPRATSAPPHLEELQRALESQSDNGHFLFDKAEAINSISDIRCELYDDLYPTYAGSKNLSRTTESLAVHNDFTIISPNSPSNGLSPFYSGLALDSPPSSFHNLHLELQQKQQQSFLQSQQHHQLSPDSSDIDHQSPPACHLSGSQSQQGLSDEQSLLSAFASLNFESTHTLEINAKLCSESGSNHSCLNNGIVDDLPNGGAQLASCGLYSHLNAITVPSEYSRTSTASLESLVSTASAPMDGFLQNMSLVGEALNTEFSNGLDGVPVPVGKVMASLFTHGSYATDLPSNGLCESLDVQGTRFVASVHRAKQQQQQDFDVYSAAATATMSLPSWHQYPNGNVPVNNLFTSPIRLKIPSVDMEMTSMVPTQQYRHFAHGQVQMEEERVQTRQLMQQQLFLRQQQLQEQQARFYASLQAPPGARGSAHTSVPSFSQTDQQATWNPPLAVNYFQQQHLLKQRPVGALTTDAGWKYQGPLAASAFCLPEPVTLSHCANTCRYFAQGFCTRGETCPFIHAQTPNERVPPSNGVVTNEGVTAESFHQEKSLSRKSTRGGQALSPATSLSSIGKRKDGLANGHIQSNGNHLSSRNRSGSFQLDGKAATKSSVHEFLAMELSKPANVQHQSSQQQQPKYSTLEEVEGHIYAIAKDQHGCRFLQRKFEEGAVEDVQKIFLEITDHITELMIDPFGNYLVQKLLEVCNEVQRMEILQRVSGKGELVTVSLNMHGTRAVQKLIETLKSPEQVAMVISSLRQGVVTLIKDLNGNHVIQRCLQRLSNNDSQFIFDAAASHCVEIATHRHGCCVLQRCVDFASETQRQHLVAEIASNALVLAQDPFGNYVVQYILDLSLPWATMDVIARLEGNFACLSMQKFSSNVVEKCLKLSGEESKTEIIKELMSSSRLGQLLQDPYANYVVQCALTVSKVFSRLYVKILKLE